MRSIARWAVLGAAAAGLLACHPAPYAEVRETPAQIRAREAAGEALRFVDVRFPDAYREGHVAGAVHVGSEELYVDHEVPLPKDVTLVLYCSCPDDHMSSGAARTLYEDYGYRKLIVVKGGTTALKAAGFPMKAGVAP